MRSLFQRLFLAVAVASGVGAVLGFFGHFHWVLDLFSHFRLQYAIVLLPATLVFWRRGLLGVVLIGATLGNAWAIYPIMNGKIALADTGGVLRVATINLNYKNQRIDAVLAYLRDANADVLLLQEVTPEWEAALRTLRDGYPYAWFATRTDPFGIALLSRRPCTDCRVADFGVTPAIVGRFEVASGEIEVVGIHPPPPTSAGMTAARDALLLSVSDYLNRGRRPRIVLGDLNATPWSAGFRSFVARSGLGADGTLHSTWPSHIGLPLIPIDHILVSSELGLTRVARGPDLGSDHYPLRADIVLR